MLTQKPSRKRTRRSFAALAQSPPFPSSFFSPFPLSFSAAPTRALLREVKERKHSAEGPRLDATFPSFFFPLSFPFPSFSLSLFSLLSLEQGRFGKRVAINLSFPFFPSFFFFLATDGEEERLAGALPLLFSPFLRAGR